MLNECAQFQGRTWTIGILKSIINKICYINSGQKSVGKRIYVYCQRQGNNAFRIVTDLPITNSYPLQRFIILANSMRYVKVNIAALLCGVFGEHKNGKKY